MKNEYEKQAADFAANYGVKMTATYVKWGKYFQDDEQERAIFKIVLKRKGVGQYTFKFGQAIAASNKKPTMYDILSCLTKSDPESFENFYSEYGYDTDSLKAKKIYKAVQKEWNNVNRLFSDCLDELSEIS